MFRVDRRRGVGPDALLGPTASLSIAAERGTSFLGRFSGYAARYGTPTSKQ